jgi:hypothetical protein
MPAQASFLGMLPNCVFDDSPASSIGSAILLRRNLAEHAFQRGLTTLCSQ